jgi:hypothetical protein
MGIDIYFRDFEIPMSLDAIMTISSVRALDRNFHLQNAPNPDIDNYTTSGSVG